jgi:hypothetical protein
MFCSGTALAPQDMKAVFHSLSLTAVHTLQNAPVEEKANLQTQTAPLMQVAQAHLDGKEAYARGIATELLEDFLQVEERFTKSGMTEQETIDAMRAVGGIALQTGVEHSFWVQRASSPQRQSP